MKKNPYILPALIIGLAIILGIALHNYLNRWEVQYNWTAYNKLTKEYVTNFKVYSSENGKLLGQ